MSSSHPMQIGSASIIGIASLENAQQDSDGDHTKAIIFDTQFYIAPGMTAIGALQYFNADNIIFEDVNKFFVYANIAQIALMQL
ncbi:hypothetical protein EI94DRAFT_1805221 [Lactarius quietus]|nr:hypothetical protein EI94DRAFT_1805221 [Lactarius quietus]